MVGGKNTFASRAGLNHRGFSLRCGKIRCTRLYMLLGQCSNFRPALHPSAEFVYGFALTAVFAVSSCVHVLTKVRAAKTSALISSPSLGALKSNYVHKSNEQSLTE